MSTKAKLLSGAIALAVVAAVAGAGAWYFVIRSDSPPAVSLQAALASLDTASAPATASGGSTPASASGSDLGADESLAGEWTLVQGANSFVGYRVEEELGGIGATTAVGRTTSIEGTLSFDGSAITSVEVTADLTTLQSDKSMRDGQLKTQALQTNTYPSAAFVLTSPIAIDEVPAEDETLSQTVEGDLTLHGVTRSIEIDVEGVVQNGLLVVVGSTEIAFADFNIAQPTSAAVLSIADHGTLELQLVFTRAS